ncbi:hypothetical protein NDU88_002526 [Pleurodeles waltl]|uniref:Uncharacterized protein n=1 Tax=Pleurodeles waltl TaxID=8319 RepID=A0AAV7SCQ0_PLEWA|nr:hypothetical protein NDU88_002526 [Pleurodeles waltl]
MTPGIPQRYHTGPDLVPKSGHQINKAARKRVEPVGPTTEMAGIYARCRGREDTGSDPLGTHKPPGLHRGTGGNGGGPRSAPQSRVNAARDSPGAGGPLDTGGARWNTPAPLKISALRGALK